MTLDDYTESAAPVARKPRKRGGSKHRKSPEAARYAAEVPTPKTKEAEALATHLGQLGIVEADADQEATEPTDAPTDPSEEGKGIMWVLQEAATRKVRLQQQVVTAAANTRAEAPVLKLVELADCTEQLLRSSAGFVRSLRDDPAATKLELRQLATTKSRELREGVLSRTSGTAAERLGVGLVALSDTVQTRAGRLAPLLAGLLASGDAELARSVTLAQAAKAWSVEHVYRPMQTQRERVVGVLSADLASARSTVTKYSDQVKDTKVQQLTEASLTTIKAQVGTVTDKSTQYVWGKLVTLLGEEKSATVKAQTQVTLQAAVDKTLPRLPASFRRFLSALSLPAQAA